MHNFAEFTMIGRLTKDVELPNNEKAPVFAIVAVNGGYMKDGEWTETTSYIPVQMFGGTARKMVENGHMKKGRAFHFKGRIESNRYEKDGQTVNALQLVVNGPDVNFMDAKPKAEEA